MPIPLNPRLVQTGWTSFASDVLPAEISKTQRVEMRRAFFAGAHYLFAAMTNIPRDGGVLDEGSMETERDIAQMNLILVELQAFVESVRQGEG